ncbi:MAG TPA: hypothetical protein VFR23_13050 [Jiangellaceae bacterium]|nr:hypothetical protein [Jiangellaceae bacterium]
MTRKNSVASRNTRSDRRYPVPSNISPACARRFAVGLVANSFAGVPVFYAGGYLIAHTMSVAALEP